MREKLIELIRCTDFYPTKGAVATIGSRFTSEFIEAIADHLIANDVVPVVRCKDCIHNFVRYGENECYCGHPDGLNDRLRQDDFCSYGERKDNG